MSANIRRVLYSIGGDNMKPIFTYSTTSSSFNQSLTSTTGSILFAIITASNVSGGGSSTCFLLLDESKVAVQGYLSSISPGNNTAVSVTASLSRSNVALNSGGAYVAVSVVIFEIEE